MVLLVINIAVVFILFVIHILIIGLFHLELTHRLRQNRKWQLSIAVFLDTFQFGFLL